MLLSPSSEQDFFRETTARYLDARAPAEEVRRLRDDPAGFSPDYWRGGAELGWTSLLVAEADGGVTVSELGLVDLTLVAHEFGRRAAPGPLLAANVVAGALSAAGAARDVVAGIVAGSTIATWCFSEPAPSDGLSSAFEVRLERDRLVLNGVKRPVESAGEASHFLVTGRTEAGLSQVLVPRDAPGISIQPMRGVDLTRRYSVVRFEDVRLPLSAAVGRLGEAAAAVERQLQHALVISNAEAVGAMQRAFDLTVEWAFDRYSFGRPLASYQALKHRFAHMATWLQASHAISDEAAIAVAEGRPEAGELASAAKAYIGDRGTELAQECVQLHGGIGVTFEHDLHLFLRRVTLARTLFGTPEVHARRLADLVAQRSAA